MRRSTVARRDCAHAGDLALVAHPFRRPLREPAQQLDALTLAPGRDLRERELLGGLEGLGIEVTELALALGEQQARRDDRLLWCLKLGRHRPAVARIRAEPSPQPIWALGSPSAPLMGSEPGRAPIFASAVAIVATAPTSEKDAPSTITTMDSVGVSTTYTVGPWASGVRKHRFEGPLLP